MISMQERDLVQRYLCLDITLQVDGSSNILLEYQSVTERIGNVKLLIEHESTADYVYRFMINNEKSVK